MPAKPPWHTGDRPPIPIGRRVFGPPPGYAAAPPRDAEPERGFVPWNPHEHLFAEQLKAFNDPNRYSAWCTTRRAGKTTTALDWLLDPLVNAEPGVILEACYVGLTKVDAEKTILDDLLALCVRHGFADPFKGYNRVKRVLVLQNGCKLEIRGLNDEGEAKKYRGRRFVRVVIDECQDQIPQTLATMVNAVISPTLADRNGRLRLCGTPGYHARKGVYWFDVSHGEGGFTNHHWSIQDNPHIPNAAEFLASQAERLGGVTSPIYRREYLGEWVSGGDELVFPFEADRNEYDDLPDGDWTYSIGLDLGFSPDRSALAVVGWLPHDPCLYLVHEFVFEARANIQTLGSTLLDAVNLYCPIGVYVDEGGLGAALSAELMDRFPSLQTEAADKRDKLVQLDAMAGDLLAGRLKFPRGSRASEDTGIVSWDVRAAERGRREVAKLPHSDILDAVRYAVGGARHYWVTSAPVVLGEEERMLLRLRQAAETPRVQQDFQRMGFR